MATGTVVGTHVWIAKGVLESTWNFIAAAVGTVLVAPNLPDKTVHMNDPTTGGTTSMTIEGGNFLPSTADVDYVALTDPQGNALTFTDEAIEAIAENPLYIRPNCTVVTTGETLTVKIISRMG